MDATRAYSGGKNRYTRAEGLSAVIAARALSFRGDVLRTIVNRVWRSVGHSLRRRRRNRVQVIGSSAQRLVVGPLPGTTVCTGQVRIPVSVRKGSGAITLPAYQIQGENTTRCLRRRAETKLVGTVMVDEADRIGQNELLIERSRNVFPHVNCRRRAIVEVSAPVVPPGFKECDATRVETHCAGCENRRSRVLQAGHVRVPVDPERWLAGILSLARSSWIIDVARWSAIGWRTADPSNRWLQLERDRSRVRRGRAGCHFEDYCIDTRRCSGCVERDSLRLSAREIRSNKVAGSVLYKGIIIVYRRAPRFVYENLKLGRIVTRNGSANAGVDRQRVYAARVWHCAVRLAKSQVARIGSAPYGVHICETTVARAERSTGRRWTALGQTEHDQQGSSRTKGESGEDARVENAGIGR